MFIKTIAVGPFRPVESCVTGGARTVARCLCCHDADADADAAFAA